MKVAELMRTELKTISVDATVADAVDALVEAQVTALPVMDRFGRAVGVISTRDVLKAESSFAGERARGIWLEQTTVLEVMSPWPPTIGPELEVRDAAQQMLYADVQRLFVEDDGALLGVISLSDIVGAVARSKA